MPHELPSLPYTPNALEPHFDARTMEIHHGKHHQTYVDKLNGALSDHPEIKLAVIDLISDLSMFLKLSGEPFAITVGFHTFFWESLSPDGPNQPDGSLQT